MSPGLVLGLQLGFKKSFFNCIVTLKVVIYKRGQEKGLHFIEIFSKMTLKPDSGLPGVPYDGILLDKNNI